MRHVAAYALGWSALLLLKTSAGELPETLAVVLVTDGPYSPDAIREMQREAGDILQRGGVQPVWRLLSDPPAEFTGEIAMVTLKGKCRMEPAAANLVASGALGWTWSEGGDVLPFGAVECDRIRLSVRAAMRGNDSDRGEFLYGRALGRVLAHELYHILRRTPRHGRAGVAQACFSGKELIADRLDFDPSDIAELRQRHGR